ncbi:MAG: VWA domain-containing protein [Planctomycetaceae bacterium]|jgi:Ca-activated chloride channel family protein|nr:VWA domain-containing protein [Planctomycetaceae bacterium]
MQNLLTNAKKPVVFCLSAAVGCFALALLAELFLLLTSGGQPAQSYCLTIDVSGSMAGEKMDEVKQAAKAFVGKQNLSKDSVAVVIFSSVGKILVPFTHNKSELNKNIDELLPYGGTNFEDAMDKTAEVFRENKSNAAVLLFTDGAPSVGDAQKAVDTAYLLRKNGIQVFAVMTADGDKPYLAGITGKDDRVIATTDGKIGEAFAQAETAMKQSLMGSGSASTQMAFIQASGWSVFLCLGIALALVAVQNYFLKKPLLPPNQAILVIIGSALAGIAAGFVGETSHQILDVARMGMFGQVVGWTVLGAVLAFGMTYFIPNLNKTKALQFGALGGFAGSIVFLIISTGSQLGGRLLGAFVLGAIIGLLVAIVETLFRNVWLAVMYDPRNVTQVNLGTQLVTVGGNRSDTVFINGAESKCGLFRAVGDNNVEYTTAGGKQTLHPGDRVQVGKVELVVCSKDIMFSASKFYPMRMSKVPR